jgi:hypothetical protein
MKPTVQHAGAPHKSVIPKSAMFLMSKEDQGSEEDADPTDGGQENETQDVSPELAASMQELIGTYGADACKRACMEATETDTADNPATDGMDEDASAKY